MTQIEITGDNPHCLFGSMDVNVCLTSPLFVPLHKRASVVIHRIPGMDARIPAYILRRMMNNLLIYLVISSLQSLFCYSLLKTDKKILGEIEALITSRIICFVIIPRITLRSVVLLHNDYFPILVREKKLQLARSAALRN